MSAPHEITVTIAGQMGAGKSVALRTIAATLAAAGWMVLEQDEGLNPSRADIARQINEGRRLAAANGQRLAIVRTRLDDRSYRA